MAAYAKGLDGIRSLDIASSAALEGCLIDHTRGMYNSMLAERARRYVMPHALLSEEISTYFAPKSRLLSSIFFGVLPRWAFLLAGRDLPPSMGQSLDALRMVRQLNDELSDVHDDLTNGLVTLPWLYALEEAPDLRQHIEALWKQPGSVDARGKCRAILQRTQGVRRAGSNSLSLLAESMDATRANFAIDNAFEITVLHNVRWAHLTRIAQNSYEDIPSPRQPSLPHAVLATASSPIVPVGGAGTLVVDDLGRVLMSLVLKRGMLRWELPAGVAKDGESMEEAAKRETLEETGNHVDIEDAIALCWHYSRELGRGWMGVFFIARLVSDSCHHNFRAIRPTSRQSTKTNFVATPELYEAIEIERCDFDVICEHWSSADLRLTAHENILASGFVDWKRIPEGRIHPLHRQLLEAYHLRPPAGFLVGDADADRKAYDDDARLYVG
jgi:8-oxo-dGTP pyrophosphatase MutT (NUDIX family)